MLTFFFTEIKARFSKNIDQAYIINDAYAFLAAGKPHDQGNFQCALVNIITVGDLIMLP